MPSLNRKVTGEFKFEFAQRINKKLAFARKITFGDKGCYMRVMVWVPDTPDSKYEPKVVVSFRTNKNTNVVCEDAHELFELSEKLRNFLADIDYPLVAQVLNEARQEWQGLHSRQ